MRRRRSAALGVMILPKTLTQPAVGRCRPRIEAQQRRLAGAVGAEQAQDAAGLDPQRHIVQGDLAVLVNLGELVGFDHQVAGVLGHEAPSSLGAIKAGLYGAANCVPSPTGACSPVSRNDSRHISQPPTHKMKVKRCFWESSCEVEKGAMDHATEEKHRVLAAAYFRDLQDRICAELEKLDGGQRFRQDDWRRAGGGGGRTRVLAGGQVFEKAGVNFSDVSGNLTPELATQIPGEGTEFTATGISLVLHPVSPMVPTVHANFRFLTKGSRSWFGGGADLTPYYPFREDVIHFHRTWRDACQGQLLPWITRDSRNGVTSISSWLIAAKLAVSAASSSTTWKAIGMRSSVSSRMRQCLLAGLPADRGTAQV